MGPSRSTASTQRRGGQRLAHNGPVASCGCLGADEQKPFIRAGHRMSIHGRSRGCRCQVSRESPFGRFGSAVGRLRAYWSGLGGRGRWLGLVGRSSHHGRNASCCDGERRDERHRDRSLKARFLGRWSSIRWLGRCRQSRSLGRRWRHDGRARRRRCKLHRRRSQRGRQLPR